MKLFGVTIFILALCWAGNLAAKTHEIVQEEQLHDAVRAKKSPCGGCSSCSSGSVSYGGSSNMKPIMYSGGAPAGYAASATGYSAPLTGYTAHGLMGYAAPLTGYSSHGMTGYTAPHTGYTAHQLTGYAAPLNGYTAHQAQGYSAPLSAGYSVHQISGYASPPSGYSVPAGEKPASYNAKYRMEDE